MCALRKRTRKRFGYELGRHAWILPADIRGRRRWKLGWRTRHGVPATSERVPCAQWIGERDLDAGSKRRRRAEEQRRGRRGGKKQRGIWRWDSESVKGRWESKERAVDGGERDEGDGSDAWRVVCWRGSSMGFTSFWGSLDWSNSQTETITKHLNLNAKIEYAEMLFFPSF